MKKQSFLSALFCIFTIMAFSQAPPAFKYSAVALDAAGNPVSSEFVVKFKFHEDSETGQVRYEETHVVSGAVNGKFNLNAGLGTATINQFSDLNWAEHQYWMRVQLSFNAGADFNNFGVSQLLSVPYALYAAQSGANSETYTPGSGIAITPGNEIVNTAPDQPVSIAGSGNTTVSGAYPNFTISSASTTYTPGQGITITPGNQIINTAPNQPVTITGSGNTTVGGAYPNFTISSASTNYTPGQGIAISPGNEIVNTAPDQPVSITGSGATTVSGAYPNFTISSASTNYTPGQGIEITAGNAINNLGDLSDTNEIQKLSIANGVISLSKNGGSVNLPVAGAGISIVNNVITNVQPDQPITLDGGGSTTVTGTYPNFTITSTGGGGVAPGTGIEMDVNGSTTVVSARNTDSIWNASALRGRPIGGMEPTSADAGRMLVYDHTTEVWKADTLKGDFVTQNDGSIQVAALRGRPIGGMEPTAGSSMLIYNSSDDQYDFMNSDSDISGDTDGLFTLNKIQGRVVDLAGMGQDMVLTCVSDGNGGLEFRCLPPAGGTGFTVPYTYTENVLNTTLFSMTANTANTNYVMQITNNGTGVNRHGIYGVTQGTNGTFDPNSSSSSLGLKSFYYPGGIFGENIHPSPYGGGVAGAGVTGRAVAGGNNRGVGGWFQGNSIGVLGVCYAEGGGAVLGYSQNGYYSGRFSLNPPSNWYSGTNKNNYSAVWARTFDTFQAYAGRFIGDVYISGDLEVAGSKFFKIDHPQDPANKYLYHSCVESPEMKNIYDGITTTDANGYATVELPAYFEALNKDFRYQLTCMGDFAQAIVAKKIENNQFVIRTDKPNMEVSWQVTGNRKDAWAVAHPMQAEVEKASADRGKYLHPELNGQPETKEIGYQREEY